MEPLELKIFRHSVDVSKAPVIFLQNKWQLRLNYRCELLHCFLASDQ